LLSEVLFVVMAQLVIATDQNIRKQPTENMQVLDF